MAMIEVTEEEKEKRPLGILLMMVSGDHDKQDSLTNIFLPPDHVVQHEKLKSIGNDSRLTSSSTSCVT